jgi:adapter protein MecA 1/2
VTCNCSVPSQLPDILKKEETKIMKIERINDNQIRATLTGQDLAERHLQLSELAYGSDKAKLLFRDLMQQASYELGFETDDIPVMIEAIPLSGGSIMLNVTKVEYPEELDSRFSNFTDFGDNMPGYETDSGAPPTLEGADGLLELFRKLGAAAASLKHTDGDDSGEHAPDGAFVPLKNTANAVSGDGSADIEVADDIVKLFSFRNMEHIIRLSHVLNGFYRSENSLFLDSKERIYYLVLHKGDHSPSEFNKVCNILTEYAFQNRYLPSAEAYFGEHFRCISSGNALQCLAQIS